MAYLFARKGALTLDKNGRNEDDVLLAVLEAGTEEVNDLDDRSSFSAVRTAGRSVGSQTIAPAPSTARPIPAVDDRGGQP